MMRIPVEMMNSAIVRQYLVAGKDPSHATGMDKEFSDRLARLLKDAPGSGVKVKSGYRSTERQAQLYAAALKKYGSPQAARKWVAPPGRSNHNHGVAADLAYASPAVQQWAHANAAKYGLNFRMGHEPWHIEMAKGGPMMAKMGNPAPAATPPAPASAPMGTAMGSFGMPPAQTQVAQAPSQAPSTRPAWLQGLARFGGTPEKRDDFLSGLSQAGMAMSGPQEQPMQQSFVVQAAPPGTINPTPPGADPRQALIEQLLRQQQA